MTGNLNLNNPYNNALLQQGVSPYFAQNQYNPNMQGNIPAMQGVDYDALKAQIDAKSKDNIVVQATKDYDVMEHPAVLGKNLALSLLMAMGFTAGTNWLMKSKGIAENASNIENFQQTRLYRMGERLDRTALGRFFARIDNSIKSGISTLGKYTPETIKRTLHQVKVGGYAIPDKTGMFSLGKGAEALNESIEFLSNVPENQIKALGLGKHQSEVLKVLKDYRAGKIKGAAAHKLIGKYFENISADKLAKLTAGKTGIWGRIFGTTPNVNLSLNKARFFNPNMLNKTQGPISKAMQKTLALIGEASGGGVLGGTGALLMNAFALITGFNAASRAEKGDKLKAFMEDYIGFTLGGYFMSFIVGSWFNKFLGVAELGLDKDKVVAVGKKLGIDMTDKRLQNVVEAYNKEFKRCKKLRSVAEKYRNGDISLEKAISKASALNIEKLEAGKTTSAEFLDAVEKSLKGRSLKDFDGLRSEIKDAFKSKVTLKSVVKGNEYNKGSFLKRLGTYLWEKPLSLIGRALSTGRYDMIHNTKLSGLKAAKRWGFGLGRAILVGFILVEPFRKGFMKLSHLVFGKPKNSQLDEEENAKKAEEAQKQAQQLQQLQQLQELQKMQQAIQQQQAQKQEPVNVHNLADTNILKQMVENPPQQNAIASSSLNDTMNAEKLNPDSLPEIKRTYIPSPMPAPAALQEDPRDAAIERALKKADYAEKAALGFLH